MLKQLSLKLLRLFIFFLFSFTFVFAEGVKEQAHDHQGKLIPYTGEPPDIGLSDQDLKILATGKPLFKKIELEGAQRGITVFRVNAMPATIWSVIRDFRSYPKWIADIENTEVYSEQGGQLHVKFVAGGLFGSNTVWYAAHDYPESQRNWGTWRLDYNFRSDIDDTVGFWRVLSVADQPNQSDVIYCADLKLKGFLTSLFESSLIDSNLKDATQWVKTQAEARN